MRAYLLLTLTMLFWSGNWIAGRYVHDLVPPVQLNFLRWTVAAAVLAPFVVGALKGRWKEAFAQWRRFFVFGLFGMVLFQTLLYWGLHYTEAINAVLLNSALPIMMILVTWVMSRETASGRQWLGVVISLGGIVAIVARGSLETLGALEFNYGDLIILAALPIWAIYSNLLRNWDTGFQGLPLTFLIVLFGLMIQVPLAATEALVFDPAPFTTETIVVFLYVGIFSSAIGVFFWNLGVAMIGPNRAGFSIHLLPLFGAALAVVVLGEAFRLYHLVGFILILTGVYISTVIPRRAATAAR